MMRRHASARVRSRMDGTAANAQAVTGADDAARSGTGRRSRASRVAAGKQRAADRRRALNGRVSGYREELHEKAAEEVSVHGHAMERGDVFKAIGLIAFFGIMVLIMVLIWPYLHMMFEDGGSELVIARMREAGVVGFLILLGLQFLQIVVAFIPGEVVQVAAGALYGPWLGSLLILLGCVVSSAFIFAVVHRLGAPFVQNMVPTKHLEKFHRFEASGKLNLLVFILFLIPGLPKDVFTYLVPLTDMRMRTFLTLTTIGRVPGVFVSTYAANGLMDGRIVQSAIIFAVAALVAVLGLVFRERIMNVLDRHVHRK